MAKQYSNNYNTKTLYYIILRYLHWISINYLSVFELHLLCAKVHNGNFIFHRQIFINILQNRAKVKTEQ